MKPCLHFSLQMMKMTVLIRNTDIRRQRRKTFRLQETHTNKEIEKEPIIVSDKEDENESITVSDKEDNDNVEKAEEVQISEVAGNEGGDEGEEIIKDINLSTLVDSPEERQFSFEDHRKLSYLLLESVFSVAYRRAYVNGQQIRTRGNPGSCLRCFPKMLADEKNYLATQRIPRGRPSIKSVYHLDEYKKL